MVVDHNVRAREALLGALGRAGYHGEGVGDVFSALARSVEAPPRVVVAELCMPDASGLQLLRAMRERGVNAPVVFLARGETRDMCTCASVYGAEACLPRPIVMDDLVWTIERALARLDNADLPPTRPQVKQRRRWWAPAPREAWAP